MVVAGSSLLNQQWDSSQREVMQNVSHLTLPA